MGVFVSGIKVGTVTATASSGRISVWGSGVIGKQREEKRQAVKQAEYYIIS